MPLPASLARFEPADVAQILEQFQSPIGLSFDGSEVAIGTAIVRGGIVRAIPGERAHLENGLELMIYTSKGLTETVRGFVGIRNSREILSKVQHMRLQRPASCASLREHEHHEDVKPVLMERSLRSSDNRMVVTTDDLTRSQGTSAVKK